MPHRVTVYNQNEFVEKHKYIYPHSLNKTLRRLTYTDTGRLQTA